jgi:uncharacterized membrane protein/Mg-chelatase subunit ChlD
MRFERPWALIVAVVAPLVMWLIARFGARTVPRSQHRAAMLVRVTAVLLLSLALAGPMLIRSVPERNVLFLLDRSDSVGLTAREAQDAFVSAAVSGSVPLDRWSVAVFGATTKVDRSLAPGTSSDGVRTAVEASATDLASALRAGAALLPTEGSRRIVVLSDLVETSGDAREAVAELAGMGIAVDVVALDTSRGPDALVESVRLPATVRAGDAVAVHVVIRSNAAGPATVTIKGAGGEVKSMDVELKRGQTELDVDLASGPGGFFPVGVDVAARFDTRPENDRAVGLTRVTGPARVLVVEGRDAEATELVSALEAGGIRVDLRSSIPGSGDLLAYDGVVLVNIAAPAPETADALAGFVEDLGRGLVVIGGDASYGLGRYHETPLESLLPVSSNPDDLLRRQPVAEVLVLDTSGSMGDCHCTSEVVGMSGGQKGFPKTDIAAAGAKLAIDALSDQDRVGVLAFSGGYDWVIPLGSRPTTTSVDDALGGLVANGDTEIDRALEQAMEQLGGAPEPLKHIVLFTDGWDPADARLVTTARKIADAGITLSVLGTGEGAGATLKRMAEVGGGRYYPGDDLASVPEIFAEETKTVARNLAMEGSFLPTLGAPSPVTDGLRSSPPLLGYVATKAKGSASVVLQIGDGDPLLASWQRGLGRVSAWTSDATSRWSAGWVGWSGYVGFWGAVVRDVLPADLETPPEVFVQDGAVHIRLDRSSMDPNAQAVARVRGPDGEVTAVQLQRTGATTFQGDTPAGAAGAYSVAVQVEDPSGGGFVASSGAVSSYEEEFSFREPDPSLAAAIADRAGGRVDPAPSAAFDPAPRKGSAERPIWPWLAAAALMAFLVDVALRRLVLTDGDAAVWKSGLVTERHRERKRVEMAVAERHANRERSGDVVSDSETLQRLMRRKIR